MSETLEQLDKVGAKTIALLDDFATKGIDFVQQQAPEVCEQIINRQLYTKIYCMCIWTILSLSGYTLAYLLYRTGKGAQERDQNDWYVASFVFVTISTLLLLVPNGILGFDICYVISAPKVYLIEYFTRLLK